MAQSMTAFARQESQGDWGVLTWELRTVNHRYLEMALRLPEELRVLEPKVRELVNRFLNRGKLDCQLRWQKPQHQSAQILVDEELVKALSHASRLVDAHIYNPAPINALDIMRWPGVLQTAETDLDALGNQALQVLESALKELTEARSREGNTLKQLILQRCANIDEIVKQVQSLLPQAQSRYRERLLQRIQELKEEPDQNRLEQELVFLAQKMDVAEEVDRLSAHVEEVRRVLNQSQPIGRRLDFLMQELHREANTLGSKSVDTETTRASVDLKVLIEQCREQVQNIE